MEHDKVTNTTTTPLVPISTHVTMAVRPGQSIDDRWKEDEQERLRYYYGCHPKLLEAFEFFQASEKQKCFTDKNVIDLCAKGHFPVTHNAPHLNLLLDGKYKVRGVLDTGSTTTIMSKGAYDLLPGVGLQPTSTGFSGVGEHRDQYKGIIPALSVRLSDHLHANINVAVVPTSRIFILIGNDLVGGCYSKLTRVAMNDSLGNMLLQDNAGAHWPVQFIRNREQQEISVASHAITNVQPEPTDELGKLFRR